MSDAPKNRIRHDRRRGFSPLRLPLLLLLLVVVVTLLILSGGPLNPPAAPTAAYWVTEARRENGFFWKIRRHVYDRLPESWIEFMDFEDPGEPFERQFNAMSRLKEFPGEAPVIIPFLTNLVSRPGDDPRRDLAFEVLGSFGSKGRPALPEIVRHLTNPPPDGSLAAWSATLSIQPGDRVVQRLSTNTLGRIIATAAQRALSFPDEQRLEFNSEWLLREITRTLPVNGTAWPDIEALYETALQSESPALIRSMLNGIHGPQWNANQAKRILALWERIPSPEIREATLGAAVIAAVQHEQTRPDAGRLFREFLRGKAGFVEWNWVFDHIVRASSPQLQHEAAAAGWKWILNKPTDYAGDLGSFVESGCARDELDPSAVRDWLYQRASNAGNPFQIADWGRYWSLYGDPQTSLEMAASIVRTGSPDHANALLARLEAPDPGQIRGPLVDEKFIVRYGLSGGFSRSFDDVFKKQLASLPPAGAAALLKQLLDALDNFGGNLTHAPAARRRIETLLNYLEGLPE